MSIKTLNDGTKICNLCGTHMLIEEYSKMEADGDELWSTGYCTYLCKKTDEMVSRADSEKPFPIFKLRKLKYKGKDIVDP